MSVYQIKEDETDGLCEKHRRDEKYIHNFSPKSRKEATIGTIRHRWKDVVELGAAP
jgi:hypothetical protein